MFAGEDVQCTITFKNIANPEGRDPSPARKHNGFAPGGERQRKLPPVHSSTRPSISRNSSFVSQIAGSPLLRGHRPAQSLHASSIAGDARSPISPGGAFGNTGKGHKHGRSISIISLGTDAATGGSHNGSTTPTRPTRGHGRSASMQVMPNRPSSYLGKRCAKLMLLQLTQLQRLLLVIAQPPTPHHSLEERLFHPPSKSLRMSLHSLRVHRGGDRASPQRRARLRFLQQGESHQGHSPPTSDFQWPPKRSIPRPNDTRRTIPRKPRLCRRLQYTYHEREVVLHNRLMERAECLQIHT